MNRDEHREILGLLSNDGSWVIEKSHGSPKFKTA